MNAMYQVLLFIFALLAGHTGEERHCDDTTPYVEFDFSTIPCDGEGKYSLTITVLTADKDLKYQTEIKGPRKFDREVTCAGLAINLTDNKFKAEVVDKTKLRVYGRIWNDKLIPATKGMVESPNLKPEELPKVKNPENKD